MYSSEHRVHSNNFGSLLSYTDSKLSFISANTSIRYARLSLAVVLAIHCCRYRTCLQVFLLLYQEGFQVQADVSYTFESILVRVKVLIFYKDAISVWFTAALSCIQGFGLKSFKSIPLSKNIKH